MYGVTSRSKADGNTDPPYSLSGYLTYVVSGNKVKLYHAVTFVARTTCLGLGVRKYKREGDACPCDGNGVCPHDSLLVLLLIVRPFQKRSRRDLALLCVFWKPSI